MGKFIKLCVMVIVLAVPFVCFSESKEDVYKIQAGASKYNQRMEDAQLKTLTQTNPKVAQLQRRFMAIKDQIRAIRQSVREGKITQDKAREQIRPLMKELIDIENNPEYQLETRLNRLFFDYPGFNDK